MFHGIVVVPHPAPSGFRLSPEWRNWPAGVYFRTNRELTCLSNGFALVTHSMRPRVKGPRLRYALTGATRLGGPHRERAPLNLIA